MGVFEDKDGYLIFTHDWSKFPTEKTFFIMATKVMEILIEKAHKKTKY